MADEKSDLFKEFEEFLAAKADNEREKTQAEDFEVEIFDGEKGVRTRRSHAKPFLQSLGIDLDPEESGSDSGDGNSDDDTGKGGSKTTRQSTGKKSNASGSTSVTRKYFVKQTPGKLNGSAANSR
ncbi:MAG TPA: hypothetical protein VHY59_07185 [Chthoniobacterales bacterium]|jgi:hypothetical protein|nr:hypothetical protein [Chthoniobacterales bacterium]